MNEGGTIIGSRERFIDPYKSLKESIKARRCKLQELRSALKEGLITEAQYNSLIYLLADSLEKTVGIDHLTGLFDRSRLEPQIERIKKELNYEGGERKPQVQSIMVIFLDVNKFKKLNDEYGHAAGDQALGVVADSLREATRKIDMIFRVGGDEFLTVLPINSSNPRTLEAIFERIKKSVNDDLFVIDANGVRREFSISMGTEVINKGDSRTTEEILKTADSKMYEDKRSDNDDREPMRVSA